MSTMSKTAQEMTDEYCLSITDEIRALETVLGGGEFNSTESPAAVEMFDTLADQSGDERDDYAPSVVDYLNAYCLEFKTLGERDGLGKWEVTGHKILRTFGGPNCWITDEGDEWVLVAVYWGGRESVQRVYAPSLVAQLGELDD